MQLEIKNIRVNPTMAMRRACDIFQYKETYGDSTRHHGEYDESGPVREEAEKLKRAFGV